MSGVQQSGWAENPFTFSESHDIIPADPLPFGIGNWLKDFFEKLKAKYVEKPPAKIDSREDIATEGWRPHHGLSEVKYDTLVPNPAFIPITQKRKSVITQKGVKGFNTHYNIMVDKSGSMDSTSFWHDGIKCNRSITARLAVSCLIKQASYTLDSFTIYDYAGYGECRWPTDGTPAYNYEDCLAWLTSDSISKVWNIVENNAGSAYRGGNGAENCMINSLAPFVPMGGNNEDSAFDVIISNSQAHNITGMITVFFTDGDEIARTKESYYGVTCGAFYSDHVSPTGKELIGTSMCYDEWLRQYGHLFYVILQGEKQKAEIRGYVHDAETSLMNLYNWTREEASMFVWGFPDDNMKDSSGEPITEVAEQLAWLFAQIGRISAGLSEEFNDLATPPDKDKT